jgi:type I restriction modification DNA specificity domain
MSRVPRIRFKGFEEDWEQRKLGEVIQERNIRTSDFDRFPIFSLTIESGITPKTERYERGSLVTKTEDLFKVVKPNEFVTNPMNLRFGALGYNTQEYDISVSGYYDVFSIDGNNCSGFWNAYFKTQHVMNIFDNLATGSLVEKKRVKYSTLKKIYLSMPSTIEEKNKVSKFMIFTDHLITLHQRKLEKLKIIKKSMFENLFPQNGEKTPKIRFSGFNEDWEQRKLISCLSLLKDGTHGTHKDYPSGPLLLSAKNIKNGRVNYDETDRRISYKDFEKIHSNFKLQVGDVLLTIVGSIGETALLQNTFGLTFQRSVAFLRLTDNIIPEFLMSEINTSRFKNELENRKSTSAQPGIYLGDLGEIPVFISKNSDEQLKIGSYFDSLNHLITLHQSKLDKLQKIKKSMLESMFV